MHVVAVIMAVIIAADDLVNQVVGKAFKRHCGLLAYAVSCP